MKPSPTTTTDLLLALPPGMGHLLFSEFLRRVPDFVYFKDRDSRFLATSQSLADKHGVTREHMIGRTDFDYYGKTHASVAFEDEQAIVRTGTPLLGKLEREDCADGTVTWALTTKLPLCDTAGVIIGTFGISRDVTEARRTEAALEKARRELLDATRIAGMAEVATGVLHNVGNVLNSINVSLTIVDEGLRNSRVGNLAKINELLTGHREDLATFLTDDTKGRQIPTYLDTLSSHLVAEQQRLLQEVRSLQQNIDHIKDIVNMQQSYATKIGIVESLSAAELIEDSLRLNSAALSRHDVRVQREFQPAPPVLVERGKVLQILVNLIRNAKYAMDDAAPPEKLLVLRISQEPTDPGFVSITVSDNGIGISAENLARLFTHGFTTRPDGHGFGLHSAALAAKEMKGDLRAHSDGPGKGAVFTLRLPVTPA